MFWTDLEWFGVFWRGVVKQRYADIYVCAILVLMQFYMKYLLFEVFGGLEVIVEV